MIAARRTRWNFALQHAVNLCAELKAPLLILEALDSDYPWANDRIHRFVLDGMAANAAACRASRAVYYPFVERTPRCWCGPHRRALPVCLCGGHGSLPRVSDPRRDPGRRPSKRGPARNASIRTVSSRSPLMAVPFTMARSYRAFVQRELRGHLREFPEEHPLHGLPRGRRAAVPSAIARRWQAAADLLDRRSSLRAIPIDHAVTPVALRGGESAARRRLAAFIATDLKRYGRDHSHPDADCTSRLSPYLHFGHISAHEVFSAVHDVGAMDDAALVAAGRRCARRVVGRERLRQRLPGPARGVARAWLQRVRVDATLHAITSRFRRGPGNARGAPVGPAASACV